MTFPSQDETKRGSEAHKAAGTVRGTAETAILRGAGDLADKWISIRVLLGVGAGLKQDTGKWALTGKESELESRKWKIEAGECAEGCNNNLE